MMTVKNDKTHWVYGSALVLLSFAFFQFLYAYHLFFKEQVQLFLCSAEYFLTYFDKPAWLSRFTGDFLTQFFYLRGGGPAVLSTLFLIEWVLIAKIIKQINHSSTPYLWSLIPAGMDWVLHTRLSHPVSVSAGTILALLFFLAYRCISNHKIAFITGILLLFATYWLAGSAMYIFLIMIILPANKNHRFPLYKQLIFVLLASFIPYLFYQKYLLTLQQAYLFPANQPSSLLLAASILLAVLFNFSTKNIQQNHYRTLRFGLPPFILILVAFGLNSLANFNLEKILSLDSETYFGHPDRVLRLSEKFQLNNRYTAYYTNMALAQTGQLPEKLMEVYQPAADGLFLPVSQHENWLTILFSNEAFYLVGDMNMAQHSAMLGMTFSPYQRSSRMVKRLAEINLVTGDYPAAAKYLRMLNKTLLHKKWATDRLSLIRNGESPNWLIRKRQQIAQTDSLRKAYDYLPSVQFLVDQNPENTIARDYLLCHLLLNKEIGVFRQLYNRYTRQQNQPLPSAYSEALLISLFQAKASQDELASYNIPPRKIREFISYSNRYENSGGDPEKLVELYGKSYWFYYHFATKTAMEP